MDRLQAMEVFVRVAELGSFSKTAEQMGLPPATVTNAIQAVEKRVGVRLLQRTTRKVTLTDDGVAYLERCQRLLAEFQDVENLFDREQPQGVVRVDLPERLAHKNVIPRLPEFFARYPDIRVKLNASDRFVDLVGEGVDCVLRVGILSDSTLIARGIGAMEQITCASKAYLDRHGRPRTLADLEQHVMVNYFSSRTGRDLPWEYMQNGELKTLKLQGQVSVASSEAYMACCLAGLGLVQAPRLGIESLLEQGVLEELLPEFKPPPLPVSIVYSHNRHLSPRVRVFVDWLAEILTVR
ncbi:LysR family transcriptional regulator [Herbaspirillum sp. RV1423]|uniref:LysR family transcriptional regulator n=1 Tax=Herbaspirillum sp. RV1423 TaxID=1443993 RepID=UPI00055260D3|nr:LysR family transcriptional regulator [Herbaspirillum sp. RV1423]